MEREASTMTIDELRREFPAIEFPEYQREPTVWSSEQKRRLMDSVVRSFDISALYFYRRSDGTLECVDGRQRINAIMSFLGVNEMDPENGFALRISNEVAIDVPHEFAAYEGKTFAELESGSDVTGQPLTARILSYRVAVVILSGSLAPDEFNLQFLRLNLGTLINAGEKLNAMLGNMRNLVFEHPSLSDSVFLQQLGIPKRRFSIEQAAAQILLQVFALSESGEFVRARHFDLQRFLKQYSEIDPNDSRIRSLEETLDALGESCLDIAPRLGNRAISVSVVVAAWQLGLAEDRTSSEVYHDFLDAFLLRLAQQVLRMREYDPDPAYHYLVEFQRHLTQAAVERPALRYRHRILVAEYAAWQENGRLSGD